MYTNRPFLKILALVLSFALLLPGTTVFAEEGGTAVGESGGGVTPAILPLALTIGTSGYSAENPATTEAELLAAITAADAGQTVYVSGTIALSNSAITIDKNIIIEGNGNAITQTAAVKHFAISSGTKVIIQNLKLVGNSGGGGIINYGEVTLDNVTIENCSSGFGGGIINFGTLIMNSGAIENCTANASGSNGGGGIYNAGDMMLDGVTIEGCKATASYGGGIRNNGTLEMKGGVTIKDCSADRGGGIYNEYNSSVTVENGGVLTLTGNTATYDGGGIYNYGTVTVTQYGAFANDNEVYNAGRFDNDGTVNNDGKIINTGTFYNSGGVIVSSGVINNSGVFNNSGFILNNGGTITGTIDVILPIDLPACYRHGCKEIPGAARLAAHTGAAPGTGAGSGADRRRKTSLPMVLRRNT